MLKVLKFGGSSLADARQFAKVKSIVEADPARRVVIVSAPGKRFSGDHKITDLLYLCAAHIKYGVSCEDIFAMIRDRYNEIIAECGLHISLDKEFDALWDKMKNGISQDELASRGEYFSARLMAEYLGYEFVDAARWIKFKFDGTVDQDASYAALRSIAEDRKVGLGHGNLGAMLLSDESKCFAFLAGHESFAAAEGAIGIVRNANKARKEPLRVILNGLGKDAAQIISRINGFTYVQTQFDYFTGKLNIVREIRYSETERADVRCYGADDVREGVAIMHSEGVDVSITGNSTNPTRFQHPVAGTYKKECIEQGKKYFSVASGGGTGRTLHPDNMAAGPASYGMTDTMGRMHSDAQFAGSSSVPAHVEMMGFLGMGNNPMVGATVAVAVAVAESLK